jgi:hypothetical protein
MRAHISRSIGAAAALILLSAGAVEAQGKGKDKEKHKDKDRVAVVRTDDRVRDERVRDERRRDDVLRRDGRVINDPRYDPRYPRGDDRYGTDGRRVPPGLAKKPGGLPPGLAKKPGGMPPGQYKKIYGTNQGASVLRDVLGRRGYTVVRSEHLGDRDYVYYRLRDGATRRAIVSPGSERLQFSNVPQSMLSEVLSRMY